MKLFYSLFYINFWDVVLKEPMHQPTLLWDRPNCGDTFQTFSIKHNIYNVVIITTNMVKITTLTPNRWAILKLLRYSYGKRLHLREIARLLKLDPKATKRHLDWLHKNSWLRSIEVGNLVQYELKTSILPLINPVMDSEQFQTLKFAKQQAIKYYLAKLKAKPVIALLFGSTASGSDTDKSDIDIMLITERKINDEDAKQYVRHQTSEEIQSFQVTFSEFLRELNMKEDKVLLSAINTGYPIFNEKYYYEVLNEQKRF
jgi:predicted nucleotidyltransferase